MQCASCLFRKLLPPQLANVFALALPATLAGLLLSACASSGAPVAPLQSDFTIAIERGPDVPPGSLYLKPVPGGLLGKTVGDELLRSKTGAKALRVSTVALSARLRDHASILRSDDSNPGELASPRELGVARIGAFFVPAGQSEGCDNFRTSLDAGTRASAMLIYVDRAGSVRGLRYTRPYIVDYRLDFPAAGIYVVTLPAQGMVVMPRTVRVAKPLRATVQLASCD